MFLLDDLLLAPIKGLAAVCRKVHEAAEEDLEAQEKAVLADLAELHHLLAVGQLSDDDFNARETGVLDRLDACRLARGRGFPPAEEQSPQEDEHARGLSQFSGRSHENGTVPLGPLGEEAPQEDEHAK
jgi:hypothetical protein